MYYCCYVITDTNEPPSQKPQIKNNQSISCIITKLIPSTDNIFAQIQSNDKKYRFTAYTMLYQLNQSQSSSRPVHNVGDIIDCVCTSTNDLPDNAPLLLMMKHEAVKPVESTPPTLSSTPSKHQYIFYDTTVKYISDIKPDTSIQVRIESIDSLYMNVSLCSNTTSIHGKIHQCYSNDSIHSYSDRIGDMIDVYVVTVKHKKSMDGTQPKQYTVYCSLVQDHNIKSNLTDYNIDEPITAYIQSIPSSSTRSIILSVTPFIHGMMRNTFSEHKRKSMKIGDKLQCVLKTIHNSNTDKKKHYLELQSVDEPESEAIIHEPMKSGDIVPGKIQRIIPGQCLLVGLQNGLVGKVHITVCSYIQYSIYSSIVIQYNIYDESSMLLLYPDSLSNYSSCDQPSRLIRLDCISWHCTTHQHYM